MPRGFYTRKGKKQWATGRTSALSVTLPEWTGFALDAQAVKIVAAAEIRVTALSPGRGKRAPQRFIVQLPSGSVVELQPATATKIKKEEAGPGLNQQLVETRDS